MKTFYRQTKRLILRDLANDDLMNVHRLYSDAKAMYFLDLPHAEIAQSQEYLEGVLADNSKNPRRSWQIAVELADSRVFIGIACLEPETAELKDGRAELSYYFLPEYWGKSYATEAGRAMIQFGFETLELNKIFSGCVKINAASENVMIRCNMQKEAEYKKHTKMHGEWTNRVEYAILREEYYAAKPVGTATCRPHIK